MGIGRNSEASEEVLQLKVSRLTCKKLMGDIDERGICTVKVSDTGDPDVAELLRVRHSGRHGSVSDLR